MSRSRTLSLKLDGAGMPNDDFGACRWLLNFAANLASNPPIAFRVSAEQVQRIDELVRAFEQALAVASNPGTRTTGAVARKNEARSEAVQAVRPVVKVIKADPMVTRGQLLILGINPDTAAKKRERHRARVGRMFRAMKGQASQAVQSGEPPAPHNV